MPLRTFPDKAPIEGHFCRHCSAQLYYEEGLGTLKFQQLREVCPACSKVVARRLAETAYQAAERDRVANHRKTKASDNNPGPPPSAEPATKRKRKHSR